MASIETLASDKLEATRFTQHGRWHWISTRRAAHLVGLWNYGSNAWPSNT